MIAECPRFTFRLRSENRLLTRVALLCALCALLLAPAALANGLDRLRDERGIVQTVAARGLELRTLDGAVLTVRVDARTRVTVNRRRATLADVQRGFVAAVRIDDRGLAREVQAFGVAAPDSSRSGNRGKGSGRGDDTR
jgi:hypothetical protein